MKGRLIRAQTTSSKNYLATANQQIGLYKIFVHVESIILLPPATHLHCPHSGNTIARLFAKYAPPPQPPLVCYTPFNIGHGNIV